VSHNLRDDRNARGLDARLADYLLELMPAGEHDALTAELAADPALRRRLEALRRALFALPEALTHETPDAAAWERLRARLHDEAAAPGGTAVSPAPGATAREIPAPAATPPAARRAPRAWPAGRRPLRWALAASLVLLLAAGGWGWQRAREVARLQREQRVVAYWMRNPDMRLTRLEPAGELRAGVLCLLPDGRAMVLQPDRAPRGARWVLYGLTPSGREQIASAPGRLLLFRTDELTGVELVQASAEERITVAVATLP
jgi:hypothetical protein